MQNLYQFPFIGFNDIYFYEVELTVYYSEDTGVLIETVVFFQLRL